MHVLDGRHARGSRETALERAFRDAAEAGHGRDGRVGVIVSRDPLLASRDDGVVGLAVAGQRRERLLADVVPVDQVQARYAHRLVGADETRDQKQRQIVPRRAPAGHDEALTFAGRHERAAHVHAHGRIARRHGVAVSPVRRRVLVVEQAGLGEDQRAGARRRERRARGVARGQPVALGRVAAREILLRRHHQIGYHDDVGRRRIAERRVRLDSEAVRRSEARPVGGDDSRRERGLPGQPFGNQLPVAARAFEDVVHAVERRRRRLGDGEDRDDELSFRVGHGRLVQVSTQ